MNKFSHLAHVAIYAVLNLTMLVIAAIVANTDLQMPWGNVHLIILLGCFTVIMCINLVAGYLIGYERGHKASIFLK